MKSAEKGSLSFQIDEFYLELQVNGNEIALLNEEELEAHPFPGLRPFKTSEFQLFKGRDGQGEELISRLEKNHFLAVIGSSGTGKSSLVRAGLIPQLLGGYLRGAGTKWNIAICRPGKDPIQNLAVALASLQTGAPRPKAEDIHTTESLLSDNDYGILDINSLITEKGQKKENLLVIVDQFEEIFRFDRKELNKPDIERDFVNLLLKATEENRDAIYVIITMRSEFLGDCVKFRGLPEAINKGQYLVPQLSRIQIREAIEAPIRLAGRRIDPDLVELLINELEKKNLKENLDQLPILQHALMTMYRMAQEEGPDTIIGLKQYEKIGSMESALAKHAEEAYKRLGSPEHSATTEKQNIARIIFQSLTESGPDLKGGRRPVELKYIHDLAKEVLDVTPEEVNEIVNYYRTGDTSFIMPPESTSLYPALMLDISHESIMRNWDKLKKWVEDEYDAAKTYQRLIDAAALYKKGEKDTLTRKELGSFIFWENKYHPNKVWAERYDRKFKNDIGFEEAMKYLALSKRAARKRKAMWAVEISALSLLLLVGIAVFLWRIGADEKKQHKIYASFVYNSIADNWSLLKDPTAALNIKELARQKDSNEVIGTSEQALFANNAFYRTIGNADTGDNFNCFALSPVDGSYVTASNGGKLIYWPKDGKRSPVKFQNNEKVVSMAFSPVTNQFLAGVNSGKIILYDVKNGDVISVFFRPRDNGSVQPKAYITCVAFSPDGKSILAGSGDSTVCLWDVNTPENKHPEIYKAGGEITEARFSPDGKTIFVASSDMKAGIFDTKGRRIYKDLSFNTDKYQTGVPTVSAFSNDGNKLAIGFNIGFIKVYYLHKDDVTLAFSQPSHNDEVTGLEFSADGNQLLSSSRDKTIIISDVLGSALQTLRGHTKAVIGALYKGQKIVSCSSDGTIRLWTIPEQEIRMRDIYDPANPIISGALSPQGDILVTGSTTGWVKVWDVKTGHVIDSAHDHSRYVSSVVFSRGGKWVLTAGDDGIARIDGLDARCHLYLVRSLPHQANVAVVAFARDSTKVLTAGGRRTLLWDLESQAPPIQCITKRDIFSAAISVDGKNILTGSGDSLIIVWDNKGNPIDTLSFEDTAVAQSIALCPVDSVILAGSKDKTAGVWKYHDRIPRKTMYHIDAVTCVLFARDGKAIVTGSDGGFVRLWKFDKQNPSEIRQLKEFRLVSNVRSQIYAIGMSDDKKKIFGVAGNNIVRIWSLEDTNNVRSLWRNNMIDPLTASDRKRLDSDYVNLTSPRR